MCDMDELQDIIADPIDVKEVLRDQCVAISAALPNCDPELLFQLLHNEGGTML